jgi:diketogulonate reductase-like aldo/keto reductase
MEQTITLNTGALMPLLGLGCYKATGENEVQNAIKDAVSIGYRLFDTASAYKNEEGVGQGIRECGIPRDQLFVTTKVWNNAQRLGAVEDAFNRSLERLGLDYVDLYLIHWPVPGCYLDTWKILENICESGRAKAIGVSNFSELQLQEILQMCRIVPAVNQIEYHPLWNQDALRIFCQNNGIAVQAYAPLARGAYMERPVLVSLAEKYNRSAAQIGLRWMIQKNISVIPKSVHVDRILSNSQIFDFQLDDMDMQAIDSMNENFRTASIPEDMLV